MAEHSHDKAILLAKGFGHLHGAAAGSWVIDGNTSPEAKARLIHGVEDGDPEILDMLPSADLSGQWADGYSSSNLEADTEACELCLDDVCSAYEDAFQTTATEVAVEAARRA